MSRREKVKHGVNERKMNRMVPGRNNFILFYFTFSSFKVVLEEPLPHPPLLHGDHRHGVRKRDDHTTPSASTQATTPPSHPSLSPHTRRHSRACKLCLFFFRPFSDQFYRDSLYPTRRVLKPPPLYHIIPTPVLFPSSLASHAAAIACICRHASKDKFFFFFFSFLF